MEKKVAYIAASLNNYGSQLQTYALYKVMKRNGLSGDVIRYDASLMRKLRRLFAKDALKKIQNKLSQKSSLIRSEEYSQQIGKRNAAFERYKVACGFYMPKTTSRRQIINSVKKYEGVILGSDQVWNPINLDLDFYTLGFVPQNMVKIAYASSFGVSEIPKEQVKKTKKYLSRIQHISVREDAGSKIVCDLIGRKVPVVCDPTALLSMREWEDYSEPYNLSSDTYVFCYFLGENKQHREYVQRFAKSQGLSIVSIPHVEHYTDSDVGYADVEIYDANPKQFVSLIKNAQYVFTDSFHATMFSIYFHKSFSTFYRYNNADRKSANSRVITVLERLGLVKQLMSPDKMYSNQINEDIDWNIVERKLAEWREESLQYFLNALKEGGLIGD